MLAAGDRAPDFTAQNQHDVPVSLTDLLRGGRLILYFYPADFTTGCTREACWLRDLHAQLLAAKVGVAGVSPASQRAVNRTLILCCGGAERRASNMLWRKSGLA